MKIKLTVFDEFFKKTIEQWCQQPVEPSSVFISDGLGCFNGVTDAGCEHDRIVWGGGRASVEESEFYWVNTILGNLRNALRSNYHAVRPKYAQRYLAEFQYRFNRRFVLASFIPRLAWIALRTPPMAEKLLKLA